MGVTLVSPRYTLCARGFWGTPFDTTPGGLWASRVAETLIQALPPSAWGSWVQRSGRSVFTRPCQRARVETSAGSEHLRRM